MEERVVVEDVGRHDLLQVDPYRRDTGTPAEVCLRITPAERRAYLEVHSPCQAVPSDELIEDVVICVDHRDAPVAIDGPATVELLREPAQQELLATICDGHDVVWDGNRWRGTLTDDAERAVERLSWIMAEAPTLPGAAAGVCSAREWCNGVTLEMLSGMAGITLGPDSTEDDIERVAEAIAEDALRHDAVLYDIEDYIRELVEDVRKEAR